MTHSFGHMDGKAHILPARVYFADTDAAGIVYHGRYIEFAERGRSEFLASIGYDVGSMKSRFGAVWVISNIDIQYHSPGYVDDVIEIVTSIEQLKSATVTMRQIIQRVEVENRIKLASASVRAAILDQESGKPKRFDSAFKAEMAALA